MLRLEMPKAIARYREIGGVLDFAFFADTEGADDDLRSAVTQTIEQAKGGWVRPPRFLVNQAQLRSLTGQQLDLEEFLGSKVNGRTGDLRYSGRYTMTDGQTVVNPSFRHLGALRREGVTIASYGRIVSADGILGQAFAHQPYQLRGDPERIQKVFDALRALILPPGKRCRILDWSGPQLHELSNYFLGEHAYWGEYLFTIHVEEDSWMTVIIGSSTD